MSTIKVENFGFIKYNCLAILDVSQDGGSEIIGGKSYFITKKKNVLIQI